MQGMELEGADILRKRLQLLLTLYPPPQGYVLFPEDSSKK